MRSPLLLLAAVALVCFCLSGVEGADTEEPADLPAYSCSALDDVPVADQCLFVTNECSGDSRIPYAVWYYCNVSPAGTVAKLFFVLAMILALPLFFCLLGDTAEVFFSPIMAHVSQSIPKMRPRFAGVTFVAMGNGAPDLSANISAIRNGEVLLSAGALTGAAMFVQCIVASEVVRVAGGVNCRGATLRDVAIYLVSMLGVLAAFHFGTVGRWFVACCIAMYILYVVWVFCGDEWHARGRPRPNVSWQALKEALGPGDSTDEEASREGLLPWAAVDASDGTSSGTVSRLQSTAIGGGRHIVSASPFAASFVQRRDSGMAGAAASSFLHQRPGSLMPRSSSHHLQPHSQTSRYQNLRLDARSYADMVWADLSDDPAAPVALMHSAPSRRLMAAPTMGGSMTMGASAPPSQHDLRRSAENSITYTPPLAHMEEGLGASGPAAPYAPHHQDHHHGGSSGGASATSSRSVSFSTAADEPPARVSGSGGGAPATTSAGGAPPETSSLMRVTEGQPLAYYEPPAFEADGGGGYVAELQEDDDAEEEDGGWWWTVKRELTIGTCADWCDYGPVRRRFRAFTFPLLLPIYAALRCTIPYVDPAGYSQPWLLVTMLCGPLAVLVYFNAATNLFALALALGVGALLAAAVHILTRDDPEALPPFDFGTTFDFGPAFFSLLGFFMGVLWIDSLASEVVGMLGLIARLCRIPPALMGLSLLAVGNSLGDLFSNLALTKRGASSTALTACFASPLFNMLLSLGLGFSANFARNGVQSVQVTLPPEVAVGGFFLVAYNLALVVVGVTHKGRLPAKWYLFARSWYCLYLACALGSGVYAASAGQALPQDRL